MRYLQTFIVMLSLVLFVSRIILLFFFIFIFLQLQKVDLAMSLHKVASISRALEDSFSYIYYHAC